MTRRWAGLIEEIRAIVDVVPPGLLLQAASELATCRTGEWEHIHHHVQHAVGHPGARAAIGRLIDRWQAEAPEVEPPSVALALEAATRSVDQVRREQSVELVWTGPPSGMPLRRTAQALQQLINEAQRDLIVISYAVYDIPEIGQALARATDRGVRLRLVIESGEAEGGHIAYNALAAFGSHVQAHAEIYRWPVEQRPTHPQAGKRGALHAKCAVADERLLLVSSANLTHHALNLNMEMGLLVRGGTQPLQVARHFIQLIEMGVLTRAS